MPRGRYLSGVPAATPERSTSLDAAAHAVLELTAPNRLEEDLVGLDDALTARGLEPRPTLLRQVVRGRAPVEGAGLVAGRLPFIRAALHRNGLAMPEPLDYLDVPVTARGRAIWPSTLGAVAARLEHRGEPVFIKPRGVAKRFTGRVVDQPIDLRALPVSSPATPVWCSEVIEIVSEYRVFLRHGEILGIQHYDGDPGKAPALGGVRAVVDEVREHLPAGCALDVGVLAPDRVVLIEANDGFSLGRYGLDADPYVDVLHARWTELVSPGR